MADATARIYCGGWAQGDWPKSMSVRDADLDDEAWDVRETFAHFGRAFYAASVLEVGLAHALMFGEFLLQVGQNIKATKGKGFDRKQYEAEFDAFMERQFAQT